MSDLALSGLAALAQSIYCRFELAKKNKVDCEILTDKARLIDGTVRLLKEQGKSIIVELDSIKAIESCFRDCADFFEEVKKEEDSFATMFFKGGTFRGKLQRLKDRLEGCLSALQLAVSVATKLGVENVQDARPVAGDKGQPRLVLVKGAAAPMLPSGGPRAAGAKAGQEEKKEKADNDDKDKLVVGDKTFSRKELLKAMARLNGILAAIGHKTILSFETDFDDGNRASIAIETDKIESKGERLLVIQAKQILGSYFDALEDSVVSSIKLRILQ